ncbi:MAG: DUF2867 domain-containing protein [Candidatus Omnitrophica bacterium]|nr:DUF2867 domain-containing protein [Candidatus Omnitrophota bacterium]
MVKGLKPVLVLGATGYVGGRLVPRLLESGYPVRAAVRSREKLKDRSWAKDPRVEIVEADVFDPDSLIRACRGASSAFYLVHSMAPGQKNFAEADQKAAENMVQAAEAGGLERIIYLSGLGEEGEDLSKHLRSRSEVGKILKSGKVPVTILRAAMLIGSGSASFEILRYLADRLPIMITPRWVSTECQPTAIHNALEYLVGSLEVPETIGQTFDIGSTEIVTYRRLMEIYAEEAKLMKRWIIPVPVLTPRLSSYWIHLVTPVHASIARPLAEGLRNKVISKDTRIRQLIPQRLLDAREAIRRAVNGGAQYFLMRNSGMNGVMPCEWPYPGDLKWAGGTVFLDRHSMILNGASGQVWQVVEHAEEILFPKNVWQVVRIDPIREILFKAEMTLPGEAYLEFRLVNLNSSQTQLELTAKFIPRGLAGICHWFWTIPLHQIMFRWILSRVASRVDPMISPHGPI